jgi:hypothetical protein
VYLPTGSNVYQFNIQAVAPSTCTLSLESSVAVPGTAEGITFVFPPPPYLIPGQFTAYVLSACVDTNCDGQLETYQVTGTGALTPTGQTFPLGSHVRPLALVAPYSSSPAYLLANLMGVDATSGLLLRYPMDSESTIVQGAAPTQEMLTGASVSVDGVLYPDTYVLTSNADAAPNAMTGGQIAHYHGAGTSALGSTTLTTGRPTGIAIYVPTCPSPESVGTALSPWCG